MYAFLHEFLSDHKGDVVFSCFGIWHILYMVLIFGLIAVVVTLLRKRGYNCKEQCIEATICIAFSLYILDFFMMPFAYGEIDLEKLPFHFCTAMCVMCFLSRHNRWLHRYHERFALLGFVSNLIYLIYPAGVGWYQIHPLSYRVVQTLLFHGAMTAYGFFCLTFGRVRLQFKTFWREVPVIVCMTAWAMLGNVLYNGSVGEYSHFFNWSFVVQDPFGFFPEAIAPYVMPFVIVMVYVIAEMVVYGLYCSTKRWLHGGIE